MLPNCCRYVSWLSLRRVTVGVTLHAKDDTVACAGLQNRQVCESDWSRRCIARRSSCRARFRLVFAGYRQAQERSWGHSLSSRRDIGSKSWTGLRAGAQSRVRGRIAQILKRKGRRRGEVIEEYSNGSCENMFGKSYFRIRLLTSSCTAFPPLLSHSLLCVSLCPSSIKDPTLCRSRSSQSSKIAEKRWRFMHVRAQFESPPFAGLTIGGLALHVTKETGIPGAYACCRWRESGDHGL